MKIDVKKDLSVLTTVNELAISRLFDKVSWIICDAIENANLSEEDLLELDLGFGVLQIKIGSNRVNYKFAPSKNLERAIIDTIVNENNALTLNIESNLVSKLTNIYKDMF